MHTLPVLCAVQITGLTYDASRIAGRGGLQVCLQLRQGGLCPSLPSFCYEAPGYKTGACMAALFNTDGNCCPTTAVV